jgi:positive regulator of sigma E activity
MTITNMQKGIILLIAGALMLFNTFGWGGQALNIIVALSALALLALGFVLVDGHKKVQALLNKLQKKQKIK